MDIPRCIKPYSACDSIGAILIEKNKMGIIGNDMRKIKILFLGSAVRNNL